MNQKADMNGAHLCKVVATAKGACPGQIIVRLGCDLNGNRLLASGEIQAT
jgi:hypothetical protein